MSTPDWYTQLSQRDKRSLLFHLLYAADSFDYSISVAAIIANFNRGFDLDIPLAGEITPALTAIIEKQDELDLFYKPLLANWRFDRIGVCTKLILRYAIWELLHTQTNRTIIINEAIELAKCYAEKDAYKFVNGILDQIAKTDESAEQPAN